MVNVATDLKLGTIAYWLLFICFLLYIPRKRKPTAAIAWLLIIYFIPLLGIFLFLVIGSTKLSKKRRLQQKVIDEHIKSIAKAYTGKDTHLSTEQKADFGSLINLSTNLTHLPVSSGNEVNILPDYDKALVDIAEAINSAEEFVNLEYYILALDETTQPIFDAMAAAVKRGVKVRVLFDAHGSNKYPRRKEMKRLLTDIGVEWHMMLPISLRPSRYNRPDLRNHRKILVIDEKVAYIGSQNLIDKTYHRKDDIIYEELVAKISGPVVPQCSAIFAADWFNETGETLSNITDSERRSLPKKTGNVLAQILPSGPSYESENNASLFAALIHMAKKKLVITNPYFVPNEPILSAIKIAASRGVDVTLINSEAIDQWMVGHAMRSFYQELMEAGVKIYLYKNPVLLHSKHITVDDEIAVIGSSNMDIRSFDLDLECIMIAYDKDVVNVLHKIQKYNLSKATQVNLAKWSKRTFRQEFGDSVARLTSALQ